MCNFATSSTLSCCETLSDFRKGIKWRAPCSSIDAVEAPPEGTSLAVPAVLRAGESTCGHRFFVKVMHITAWRGLNCQLIIASDANLGEACPCICFLNTQVPMCLVLAPVRF